MGFSTQTKHIMILTHGPVWAPRVNKEAMALSEVGYRVTVLAAVYDEQGVAFDREVNQDAKWRYRYWGDFRNPKSPKLLWARVVTRAAKECLRRFDVQSPQALGYAITRMLRAAIAEKADLTIVHGEPALWVGRELLKRGLKVGVDLEDWYSEDLFEEKRRSRPIRLLKSLEKQLLSRCSYAVTTSEAMANALAESYGVRTPAVVYNSFPDVVCRDTPRDRADFSMPSVHWYSQTIGPGRGLEDLFASLPLVKVPMQLHLRGRLNEASRQWLHSQIPNLSHVRVFLHDLVSPKELPAHIAEHDIGLSLEQGGTAHSRALTVTNKIFQYLQAGLAVVATDTAGQLEISRRIPSGISVVSQYKPAELADALNALLADPEKLKNAKSAALNGYKQHFGWPMQAEKLKALASIALTD